MRILLVYPKFAAALWAYDHALEYIHKKASSPPLGLLTVAAMLPAEWEKKLVDLNIQELPDSEIKSADYVLLSAMLAQYHSANEILKRCKSLGVSTVAGGPLYSFSTDRLELEEPDHKFRGEAEEIFEIFLSDLQSNHLQPIYKSNHFPDIQKSPIPLWSLIEKIDSYTMMAVQFTRGCPYDCEFCDVVAFNGHKPRIKNIPQILRELEALYELGWKGHIFVCDDNFIGNNARRRELVLKAIIDWMRAHDYPYTFSAAVSLDLADQEDIMDKMVAAGFDRVTIGIETPNIASLEETNKLHNIRQDMIDAVRRIQRRGLEVQGGFIIGFDHDPTSIYEDQIHFIQESGIATAMISMLFAFPGSRLYNRLEEENRLLDFKLEESAYGAINFEPIMGIDRLREGHLTILDRIYSPEFYYYRLARMLDWYQIPAGKRTKLQIEQLRIFLKVIRDLGMVDEGRQYFWRIIWHGIKSNRKALPMIVRLMVTGYNFRKDITSYRLSIQTSR